MGILESLFGKKETITGPFKVKTTFHPYRLKSKTNDNIDMHLELTNNDEHKNKVSLKINVDRGIGIDSTMIKKTIVKKLGEMKPNEKKEIIIKIHSSSSTKAGEHKIGIVVYSHFRDYAHILNAMKKIVSLRVV